MRALRRIKPKESEIQAGILKLLNLMPEVAWAHKVSVGEYVIIRPLNGASVRKQLQPAVNLGIIKASQIGFIQGAPEGTLDIALQLTGIGAHCELEVKVPGQHPTDEQENRIGLIRRNGGFSGWVDSIEDAQATALRWHNMATALRWHNIAR